MYWIIISYKKLKKGAPVFYLAKQNYIIKYFINYECGSGLLIECEVLAFHSLIATVVDYDL
jgi:hypothetical protein